jgi:hypothetical protein
MEMHMEGSLEHLSGKAFATYWIPLDNLVQQWGRFGAEAVGVPALHATGAVFSALARETEARKYHVIALHTSHNVDLTDLETALDELNQARERWTDAITALELLVSDEHIDEAIQNEARILVTQVMEQRLRISSLIQEVEWEQFTAYHKGW